MMEPLVSVIIPIYKVEDYLQQCVDSVRDQSYKNLEIILVDDGSPDACPQLCDKYAKEDSRIKVIHKKNGGLSDARNAGIRVSTGEYIIFIDSDDFWISHDTIKELVEVALQDKADLVFMGRTTYIGNKIFESSPLNRSRYCGLPTETALRNLLVDADFIPSAYQKLIKRSVLTDNQIFFTPDIISEDSDWSVALYLKCNSISAINKKYYGYRKRKGSISETIDSKSINDVIYILEKWTTYLKEENISKNLSDTFYGYLAYAYSCLIGNYMHSYKDKDSTKFNILKSYSFLLDYDFDPKVQKVKLLKKILGFKGMCCMLGIYLRFRSKRLT